MFIESFKVDSPNVKYTEGEIHSVYNYETTELLHENKNGVYQWTVKPKSVKYEFKTDTHVPKLGVMLVGWGGNNGSTLTAGVIANRETISWATSQLFWLTHSSFHYSRWRRDFWSFQESYGN